MPLTVKNSGFIYRSAAYTAKALSPRDISICLLPSSSFTTRRSPSTLIHLLYFVILSKQTP